MSIDLPCIHDMHPADCVFCRPAPPAPAAPAFAQPAELGPWITAGYGSDCAGCGDPIEDGDRIRSDGRGGWLCTNCGNEDPRA
jgi:hypothetical protein